MMENKSIIKNKSDIKSISNTAEIQKCNVHVMPTSISDSDITALFNGIVNVMRKKIELDARAELINMNVNIDRLTKRLNEKQAECNRLKNEILFLRSKLDG